jgi:hypothetical protein
MDQNTFQMHTHEEIYELIEKAFKLGITPDELFIAIARLTNVAETEPKRISLIEVEHAKLEEKHHPVDGGELLEVSPADE